MAWSRAERKPKKEEAKAEARMIRRQQEVNERFARETLNAVHRAYPDSQRCPGR